MAVKIQVRRGSKAGLPKLSPGEFGFATDTKELFIGGQSGNIQVASKEELNAHVNNKSNPHGVTAAQVGAVPTGRKVNGKALSTDITLSAADVGADSTGTAAAQAKAVQDNLNSHTGNKSNPHGVTKAQVGLGNVDNTSDANKPISTQTKQYVDGLIGNINSVLDAINGEVI